MTKLVSDMFIRRLSQIFLLSIGIFIVSVCACFVFLALEYANGDVVTADGWKYQFFNVLSFPFDSSLGTFMTGLSAIIPIMLAAVCFTVDTSATPPKVSDKLNHTGHLFILLLALGIALSILAIFLVSTENMTPVFRADNADAGPKQLRALFGAFLAVQGAYISQLVKDKT